MEDVDYEAVNKKIQSIFGGMRAKLSGFTRVPSRTVTQCNTVNRNTIIKVMCILAFLFCLYKVQMHDQREQNSVSYIIITKKLKIVVMITRAKMVIKFY